MFTRKKSIFKRKSFYITIAAVFGVGCLLLTLMSSPAPSEEANISANVKKSVQETDVAKNQFQEQVHENNDSDPNISVQENTSDEYYLVKESDGLIKVYRYDSEGTESLVRTTDILFSMLGQEDQQLFSEGVKVNTEEELLELLQDFES